MVDHFDKITNLVKLCYGIKSVGELQHLQQRRVNEGIYTQPEHVTRNTPRRSQELLNGGSIYWIIDGLIQVRQRIIQIESRIGEDSVKRCALIFDSQLIHTEIVPRKPFQGWRYLEANKSPKDLPAQTDPNATRRILKLLTQYDVNQMTITAIPNFIADRH